MPDLRCYFSEGMSCNNIHSSLRYIEYNLIFDLEGTAGSFFFFAPLILYTHVKMLTDGFLFYNTLYYSFVGFIYHIKWGSWFVCGSVAVCLVIKVILVHYRKCGKESKILTKSAFCRSETALVDAFVHILW